MSFQDEQIRSLQRAPNRRWLKQREIDGRQFPYLEGWRAIAEANRIFGYAAWDRETMASECVAAKSVGGRYAAAYLLRVRVTVRAGDTRIVREGCGAAEAFADSPGEAHERAAKAAETDATKRALSTFGASFGLTLYSGLVGGRAPHEETTHAAESAERRAGANDDHNDDAATLDEAMGMPARIDKSALALSEPKRRRAPDHLRFVAANPCLVCARQPSQAHHLRFAQPRALGRKVSDEFTVPLCRSCHQQLHLAGDEKRWWRERGIEPLPMAERLWRASCVGEEAAE